MPELTRREVVLGAAAMAAVTPAMVACAPDAGHEGIARELRRPIARNTSDPARLLSELVRYSALAPSSHNTQCWKFRLQPGSITIEPDLARRCPIVDPDDHHMFVSLGCATENLAQASLANGLRADAQYNAAGAGSVEIRLEATKAVESPLFQAISERQCTRGDYDGKPIARGELQLLGERCFGDPVKLVRVHVTHAAVGWVIDSIRGGNAPRFVHVGAAGEHAAVQEDLDPAQPEPQPEASRDGAEQGKSNQSLSHASPHDDSELRRLHRALQTTASKLSHKFISGGGEVFDGAAPLEAAAVEHRHPLG